MIFGIFWLNVVAWIIYGFLVGSLVHYLDRSPVKGGIVGTIILGVLGALFGGWLASVIFGIFTLGFDMQSFVVAIIGGLLLSYFYRFFFREDEKIKRTTDNHE